MEALEFTGHSVYLHRMRSGPVSPSCRPPDSRNDGVLVGRGEEPGRAFLRTRIGALDEQTNSTVSRPFPERRPELSKWIFDVE